MWLCFLGPFFGMIRVSKLSKQGVGSREAAASLSATLDPGTKVCWQIAGRKMSCCCTGGERGKKGIHRNPTTPREGYGGNEQHDLHV